MSEQITSAMLDELERLEQALEAESGSGFEPIDPWPVTPAENALILALLNHGSALIAAARRAERMTEALGYIRDHEGEVCPLFTDCKHVECSSSFAAWMVADTALRDTDEGWRAIRAHYPRAALTPEPPTIVP